MKKYYRLEVDFIPVLTTENYEEACRQYDVWLETHDVVQLYEMNI